MWIYACALLTFVSVLPVDAACPNKAAVAQTLYTCSMNLMPLLNTSTLQCDAANTTLTACFTDDVVACDDEEVMTSFDALKQMMITLCGEGNCPSPIQLGATVVGCSTNILPTSCSAFQSLLTCLETGQGMCGVGDAGCVEKGFGMCQSPLVMQQMELFVNASRILPTSCPPLTFQGKPFPPGGVGPPSCNPLSIGLQMNQCLNMQPPAQVGSDSGKPDFDVICQGVKTADVPVDECMEGVLQACPPEVKQQFEPSFKSIAAICQSGCNNIDDLMVSGEKCFSKLEPAGDESSPPAQEPSCDDLGDLKECIEDEFYGCPAAWDVVTSGFGSEGDDMNMAVMLTASLKKCNIEIKVASGYARVEMTLAWMTLAVISSLFTVRYS